MSDFIPLPDRATAPAEGDGHLITLTREQYDLAFSVAWEVEELGLMLLRHAHLYHESAEGMLAVRGIAMRLEQIGGAATTALSKAEEVANSWPLVFGVQGGDSHG